jgi:sulfatase modifying factor 1
VVLRAGVTTLALTVAGLTMACPAEAPSRSAPPAGPVARAPEADPVAPRGESRTPLAHIPAGRWRPLYRTASVARSADPAPGGDSAPPPASEVTAFELEVVPVSNADFLRFVEAVPAWRRSRTPELMAAPSYLAHWAGDLELGRVSPTAPVTRVSWFAARAYARWVGRRLPTTAEWERAAVALDATGVPDRGLAARALRWCSTLEVLAEVGSTPADLHGVRDLHSLWEWTEDWNASLLSGEQRGARGDDGRFCGGGALGATRRDDMPAFMREALRGSIEGRDALGSLGFRCAADASRGTP